MMRRAGGILLTVTGFLACPCHLIVTLPLLASLVAGTALGTFLTRNTGLITAVASVYFVGALALGAWCLFGQSRPKRVVGETCSTCVPAAFDPQWQEQPSREEDTSARRR